VRQRAQAATLFGLFTVLFPALGHAQSTIAGLVTDTSGAVLPGVSVEASSPALIERVRTVTTDSEGRYAIVDVRPGVYAVTFSLPGFAAVKREGIEVVANVNVPVNAQMRIGGVEETITVSGATPVVDVQQAARREVLTRDVLDALPTSRTLGASGVIVPGVKLTKPDLGGIASFSQAYIQARGKGAEQNAFEVDGLDVRTIRGCPSTQYTNFALAQEVSVQTSANSAESSGGGIRINLIPREGSNTFHGDTYIGGMTQAWQSNNITPELKAIGLPTPDSTVHMFDASPAAGGPLIADHLWFFGSYRLLRVKLAPAGAHYFDTRAQGFNTTRTDSGTGRITWQLSQKNRLAIYMDRAWKGQSNVNTGNSGPTGEYGPGGIDWATSTTIWKPGIYYIAYTKLTSAVSDKLLLENGFAWNDYTSTTGTYTPPTVEKPFGSPEWYANAPRIDFVRGTLTVAPAGGVTTFIQPAYVLSSAASYVTGSHTFKVGFQWKSGYIDQYGLPPNGGLIERFSNGVPDAVDVSAAPSDTKSELHADLGVFAQDSWTLKRLTVNPGVRFEYFSVGIGATSMGNGRFLPPRTVPESNPVPAFKNVVPRLSVAYDLFGNARTALKFSANKYMATLGALAVSPYNPIGSASDRRNWFDCALMPGTSTCNPALIGAPGYHDGIAQDNEIGPSTNNAFGFAAGLRADPNLTREYNWDYSLGVQHQLFPRVSVVGAWYHTKFSNLQVTHNVLVTSADYTPFQTPSPLNNGEMITVFNLNRNRIGLVDNLVTNSSADYRLYNGFELSVQGRLPNGGTVLAGWFADRLLTNTCDGASAPAGGAPASFTPNQYRYCDQTGQTSQDYGAVPTLPFRKDWKVAVAYPLPWGVQASLSYVSLPGGTAGAAPPSVPDYLANNWVVPANLFPGGRNAPVTVNLIPPGTRYLDRWNQIDIGAKKAFKAGGLQVQPQIDVFNLLNSSTVLTALQAFGPNLYFPTSILQGRFMKLGVTVKF
jgi:hypothetical protein